MTVQRTGKCIACDLKFNLDQEGHENIYCSFCSIKREEFGDTINGEINIGQEGSPARASLMMLESLRKSIFINIGQEGSPARASLMMLENLRKSIFKVWLYKRVDSLFGSMSGANVSVELYENDAFIAESYAKKIEITELLIEAAEFFPSKYPDDVASNLYHMYATELMKMRDNDNFYLDECNSKISGNQYIIGCMKSTAQ